MAARVHTVLSWDRYAQAGAPIQKLFPGVAGGPAFVKAVSAALPMLKINPTVSAASADARTPICLYAIMSQSVHETMHNCRAFYLHAVDGWTRRHTLCPA